ncbi:MAG: M60 family metallopeptidase [Niabella sp.]
MKLIVACKYLACMAVMAVILMTACSKKDVTPVIEPEKKDTTNTGTGGTTTPKQPAYIIDSTIEIQELPKAETEQSRMGSQFPQSDYTPVGFYLPAGATVKINVQPIYGSRLPKLLIGTYSRGYTTDDPFWQKSPHLTNVQLMAGENSITNPSGVDALLYLRYNDDAANSKSRISFQSGMRPVPFFKKGKTTRQQWLAMLDSLNDAPDVQLLGEKVIIVTSLANARKYKSEDQQQLLTLADSVVIMENEINGFDGNDALDQPGSHRYLLVQHANLDYYFYAFHYRTAYASGSIDNILVPNKIRTNGWGVYHEIGHMYQQTWKWGALGEVTNNIYSLYVQRKLGGASRLLQDNQWGKAATYLALHDSVRNFNDDAKIGVFVRLCMFRQLELAFGDAYEVAFHKQYRKDKPGISFSGDASKMKYFMLTACMVSGKNLSDFFKKWGMPVSSSVYTEIAALGLPAPNTDITLLKE